jgi:hypothetical protein
VKFVVFWRITLFPLMVLLALTVPLVLLVLLALTVPLVLLALTVLTVQKVRMGAVLFIWTSGKEISMCFTMTGLTSWLVRSWANVVLRVKTLIRRQ